MKRIVSLIFTLLMLLGVMSVTVLAEKDNSASHSVTTFDELEDYIEDLDDHFILELTILNDIVFEDEIEIDAEDVDIYFHGPATFMLPGEQGFYVDDDHVNLYFDNITIKGTARYTGDGQGIYVSGYGCNCLISGACFDNCSTYKEDAVFTGLDYCGGAIDVDGESCTIDNCYFKDCAAQGDAGAIYIDDDKCVVQNCTFENCFSLGTGGAIYICYEQDWTDIIDCKFINCGKYNEIGKNVFAMNEKCRLIRPTPYTTEEKWFTYCKVLNLVEAHTACLPAPYLPEDGNYIFYCSYDPSKCMEIANGKDFWSAWSSGTELQICSVENCGANVFHIERDGDTDTYKISALYRKVLTVKDGSWDPGTTIYQWDDLGDPSQRWRFYNDTEDGSVYICAVQGGYMDIARADTTDGTPIISYGFTGGANQRFRLEKAESQMAGSALSEGSVWIVCVVGAAAVIAVVALVIGKKKRVRNEE